MSHRNYLRLEIGIIDSLLIQWNGPEEIKITNFSTILKFAIAFRVFEYLCLKEFNDHYWPTKL